MSATAKQDPLLAETWASPAPRRHALVSRETDPGCLCCAGATISRLTRSHDCVLTGRPTRRLVRPSLACSGAKHPHQTPRARGAVACCRSAALRRMPVRSVRLRDWSQHARHGGMICARRCVFHVKHHRLAGVLACLVAPGPERSGGRCAAPGLQVARRRGRPSLTSIASM